jgi:uncharacterized lipoprotein YmbA
MLLIAGVWALTGCTGPSPQVQYYTLTPLGLEEEGALWESDGVLMVGPVTLPDALDRPHMATQSGDNRLVFAETHRWAGSLQDQIARVLADNLSILLGSNRIIAYGGEALTEPTHRITINIQRFIAQAYGDVALDLRWTLKEEGRENSSVLNKSRIRLPVEEPDYSGIVAAQSAALADLSREMAAYIRRNSPL